MKHTKLLNELKKQERSMAYLGRRLNITRQYVQKMISGQRTFSDLYKRKCAQILDVEYNELFDA